MTIFGQSRLGRMGYVFIALLMLVFDFAKAPIEKLIVSQHDQVAEQLLNPRPATPEEIKRLNQVQNMFAPSDDVGEQRLTPHRATRQEMEQSKRLKDIGFQGNFQREVLQEYMKSDGKMSDKQFEARVTQLAVKSLWDMGGNFNASPEVKALENQRSTLAMAYPIAVLVMTGITIIVLLFMISARLRDIGWPPYIVWAIIAPIFLPKLLHLSLPALAVQGIGLAFYGALIALALIPGQDKEDDTSPSTTIPAMPDRGSSIRTSTSGRSQFGRLNGQSNHTA